MYYILHDTATTEINTNLNTLSLHDALPISENNLNKKEIIMVGDSRSDAFCSKNAGIDFALALWGAFETNLPTTYKLSNVNEILNLIEKD